MQSTPKGFRLHIGIFGRRNAGKSSLLNAMTRQQVAIVSDVAGTTTDPVEKPMELLPLGPVLFIDTAGIDDDSALGGQRIEKTRQIFDRIDVAILVVDSGKWGPFEESILEEFSHRKVPRIVVFNKADLMPGATGCSSASAGCQIDNKLLDQLEQTKTPWVAAVASRGEGTDALREALIQAVPEDLINTRPIVSDLVGPGELAVLVVPIDAEAPKGRLILPEVQTIRDLLDGDAMALVVKEDRLPEALARLNRPPALVVTDSQAFRQVADAVPPEIPMTSFSILFARQKGDLNRLVEGVLALDRLRPGDRVLVAEACTHHPITDDIGRTKIPRWIEQYVGSRLNFTTTEGHDMPENLADYQLVVHCGACMWNRRAMLSRIYRCGRLGVPITNYGLAIAYTLGLFERALRPFPAAMEIYRQRSSKMGE